MRRASRCRPGNSCWSPHSESLITVDISITIYLAAGVLYELGSSERMKNSIRKNDVVLTGFVQLGFRSDGMFPAILKN